MKINSTVDNRRAVLPYGDKINNRWGRRDTEEKERDRNHYYNSDYSDPEDSEVDPEDPRTAVVDDNVYLYDGYGEKKKRK